MSEGYVVRLRGLPWSCKADEIQHFLRECNIKNGEKGIHFTFSREGRPSGEAFVELESEEDITNALAQNNEHIGSRYIEVFKVDKSEMDWMIKRAGADVAGGMAEAVVKLRGLPFGCSKEEIAQFFTGLEIVPNGIMLPEDRQGRSTGEAFVQFASPSIAERALKKDKERIGHRYIEIFKSSMSEANAAGGIRGSIRPLMGGMSSRPGPYDRGDRYGMGMGMGGMGGYGRGRNRNLKGLYDDDFDDFPFAGMSFGMRNRRGGGGGMGFMRGGGSRMNMDMMDRRGMQPGACYISKTGHSVHMRGLPFQALEQDVFDFFSPIQPVRCEFEFGGNGRPTGEANVDFATHQEAVEAMQKHKTNMQHRYIELFLNSEPNIRGGGGGGGYGNGFGGGSLLDGDGYNDDIGGIGFGQGSNSGSGFGGGYGGSPSQSGFGGGQIGFGNQGSGFGGGGFGSGGSGGGSFGGGGSMNNYDMGGGYGDGMGGGGGGGGRMMGNNYTAF
ncbi:heterogeneous nuclear ribonucleoprotein F-like isoform X2 [Biomphalaria glabrata]|uniref:Heterogeneous nuclear ribonucleoprotein F-like isoform X2 n=1 Tax=Biomphalaria glabrata TaxID=6526 RepID=A0A9W2ZMN1_BIOGL|nr:heterogeneous nuclear ribonucleoprotein F-like isoform X2 [Biomphalaria glabrata]